MVIRNRNYHKGHTYIMGIMNLTPDSFSDGGALCSLDAVLDRAEEMIGEGVDIIDIGGESTRPGYTQISSEEEIRRIKPAVFAIRQMFDVPVSVDTYKPKVAEAAIEAGADMINDIWGLQWELVKKDGGHQLTEYGPESARTTEMARIIAESGVACCLMHNRISDNCVNPGTDGMAVNKSMQGTENIVEEVRSGLYRSLKIAEAAGIASDRIVLDPGIGFGKTYAENMELLQRLDRIAIDDFPMLLGASRKSVIGLTLDLPAGERLEGTLATTAAAVAAGYMFARVHDVKENYRFIRMWESIRQN